MTTVYPRDEKPNNFPPTYEQATNYPQDPPIATIYGMQPPQQQPIGMYSPTPIGPPPHGLYPSVHTMQPTGVLYQSSGMIPQHQGPPVGTHMLITTQSLIYGDLPIQCICPHCHQTIATRIEKQTGLVSWLACGGILLFGGWLGCCLIPFCVDSLKDTEHYCPNCAVLLGTRRRM
ncbi:hypothetical protein I4U23_010301 [Adineta vaga]|nr:hypothetical protein I4U23_010301 [Adineta vaga]